MSALRTVAYIGVGGVVLYYGLGYVRDAGLATVDKLSGATEDRGKAAKKLGVTSGKDFVPATATAAAANAQRILRLFLAYGEEHAPSSAVRSAAVTAMAVGAMANAWAESRLTTTAGGDVEDGVPMAIGVWQLHARGLGRGVSVKDSVNLDASTAIVLHEADRYGMFGTAGAVYSAAKSPAQAAATLCGQWCDLVERPASGCSSRWAKASADKAFRAAMVGAGIPTSYLG